METKKISFGFIKTKKQDKPVVTETKEYIECVEEKAIKVVGGETVKEDIPLVIPMKPNTLVTAEKLRHIAEQAENFDDINIKKEDCEVSVIPENETVEQMAARELLEEARKKKKGEEEKKLVVNVPSQPVLEGQKESTLDDYDSVPIQEFGMAMLRGMGWTAGKDESKYKQPVLRPKGLGLGADKVIGQKQSKKSRDNEEELAIVKKAFVKVTSGKYSGLYGQVVSLDEENGRAMVDITMKKETVSLSEFMMHPVTKAEYDKQSKVINAESYAEYKRNESDSISSKKERIEDPSGQRSNERTESRHKVDNDKHSNGRQNLERRYSSDKDRSKSKSYKKYSSTDSDSDSKSRRRSSSSESNYRHKKKKSHSKSSKEKRDIDKKRKGKKKKRDRDRSPNYKKHRK
ncbi:G-patch domain and KOW motifs-containing protein isoform X1 [Leptidea sinapis]|uniref:G-patch domain and KOW motifs-containing protein isoform X1 n=1 Tax=Leptidea sinapis TaxID=189913 RepID=UPI0021416497|nr:G-patch domain and KOW motifs-containing protein isoform X1 [Leptidea sinapis]XP_050667276.1 G-patch domain and KOW motifs-containing protein isoform X1 [Leptidea sinapis]XP_050667277.1 G-patch domain and KOW motifs-containing protein isoform X1 [Leptidea sinapis]